MEHEKKIEPIKKGEVIATNVTVKKVKKGIPTVLEIRGREYRLQSKNQFVRKH